jgi:hypothetical protein
MFPCLLVFQAQRDPREASKISAARAHIQMIPTGSASSCQEGSIRVFLNWGRLGPVSDRDSVTMASFFFISILLACAAADMPFRLPSSPYPFPSMGPNCAGQIFTFDDTVLTPTQLLTVQTLQGTLARSCPQLVRVGSGVSSDMQTVFVNDLPQYGASINGSLRASFRGLLQHFRPAIQG